jgi:zinc-binding alcohol dehydrogenase/oxidoreductase
MMKALLLSDKNQEIQLREVPEPVPGLTDAIVKIYAAALNHRDIWIQKGQYAGLKYPIILGSDGAGVVHSTGHTQNNSWIGKEVIINPSLHWGNSPDHQDSATFKILGLPDDGTFAEYVKVPITSLFEKPPHLSFEEAAALPLTGLTSYRSLFQRANLRKGEKILISGIGGGVALFTLQFAVAAKAHVFVTSSSAEKITKAIELGAEGGAIYLDQNWSEQLIKNTGSFDVVIDGAAGPDTGELLNLAAPGGRILFYGATKGNATQLEMRRIFWKQLNIMGSTMGSPADFESMISFVIQHSIRPVIDQVFPFHEGQNALTRMDEGKQFGKILIKISGT